MICNSLLQKTGCHCYCLVDKVGGTCIFAFELTQSYISRNPLIWNKLNSRGTTGINTSNMTFQVQHCQLHLCIFPPFPGKKEKFCRWPPKNWRRQQVVSEIYPCLNPTTPISPAQYWVVFWVFFPHCSTEKYYASHTFIMFSRSSGNNNFIWHKKMFVI